MKFFILLYSLFIYIILFYTNILLMSLEKKVDQFHDGYRMVQLSVFRQQQEEKWAPNFYDILGRRPIGIDLAGQTCLNWARLGSKFLSLKLSKFSNIQIRNRIIPYRSVKNSPYPSATRKNRSWVRVFGPLKISGHVGPKYKNNIYIKKR